MNKIISIEKSKEKDGYAEVWSDDGKVLARRVWEDKKGASRIFIQNKCFVFEWENETAKNIRLEVQKLKSFRKEFAESLAESSDKLEVENKKADTVFEDGEVRHPKYEMIKSCISSKIPVYLVGPAGSGKNHTLEQIAYDLDLEFYFTNSVQQEFKLTGFIDAGGRFHETEFYKAFKDGGLFFLDEMDASIPEVLVLLNAAIANGYFEFPNGRIEAHKKFRVVAAGNTLGNGADEQYVGRLTLDQATLDRFAIISFDYCEKIELHLAKGDYELVNFIREIRKQANSKGIRATFSYRAITMVVKLEKSLDLVDILEIAVFKGIDKDTLNCFYTDNYQDRFNQALNRLKERA